MCKLVCIPPCVSKPMVGYDIQLVGKHTVTGVLEFYIVRCVVWHIERESEKILPIKDLRKCRMVKSMK